MGYGGTARLRLYLSARAKAQGRLPTLRVLLGESVLSRAKEGTAGCRLSPLLDRSYR